MAVSQQERDLQVENTRLREQVERNHETFNLLGWDILEQNQVIEQLQADAEAGRRLRELIQQSLGDGEIEAVCGFRLGGKFSCGECFACRAYEALQAASDTTGGGDDR